MNNPSKKSATKGTLKKSSKPVIRLGVVSTIWKRFDLTDIVFANIAYLKDSLKEYVEIIPVAAGSEGNASRELALRHGFSYIEVENMPLGKKWNAALSLLRDKNVDGVIIVGSDDLLNEKYFKVLLENILAGHHIIGVDIFYMFDRYSSRLFIWHGYLPPRSEEPIGLGRFIHRHYLERMDYKLWDDASMNGLDASMWDKLRQCADFHKEPFTYQQIKSQQHEIILLDIKHETQMWTIEDVILSASSISILGDSNTFLKKHFPNVPWDTIFLVPPLCLPDIKLENISYTPPTGRHICFVLPSIPVDWRSNMEYCYIAWIQEYRKKGYEVSLVVHDTIADSSDLNEYGLSNENIYEANSTLAKSSHYLHEKKPDTLIYCADEQSWSTMSDMLPLCKTLKASKVIADVRFLTRTESAFALIEPADCIVMDKKQKEMMDYANAIPVKKEIFYQEQYALPLQDKSFIAKTYRPDIALNIESGDITRCMQNIIETPLLQSKFWQPRNIRLFIGLFSH